VTGLAALHVAVPAPTQREREAEGV
jgi:hypothetical protein